LLHKHVAAEQWEVPVEVSDLQDQEEDLPEAEMGPLPDDDKVYHIGEEICLSDGANWAQNNIVFSVSGTLPNSL
jgi:hypothetical protein